MYMVAPKKRAWLWVGLLGLLITSVAGWWLEGENQRRLAQELERQASRVAQQIESRFGLYEYGLRGAGGVVLAGGGKNIRRETFAAYSLNRELSREFPGARGYGFIRRWSAGSDRDELRRARADGMADFQVRELAPNLGDRFVIEYIYPQANNHGATGLDIASERNRRDTAVAAARTATVRLSGPITLIQAEHKVRQGFLILLPVYRQGVLPEDGEGRLAATLGWSYAPLLAEEVLKPLVADFPLLSISLGERDELRPFFETHPNDAVVFFAGPVAERTLSVFGRTWRLQVRGNPAMDVESRMAPVWLVLALGSLLSALVSLITRLATSSLKPETAGEALGTGLFDFLRSPLARWYLLVLAAFLGAYAAFNWWQVRESVAARFERDLQALADQRSAAGETAMKSRRAALVYLRGTPPVDGLIRSDTSGRDPLDGSSARLWRQRMALTFRAYANANPDVSELRLIRLTGTASQLVTWRREVGSTGGGAILLDQPPDVARLRVLGDLRAKLMRGEGWTHPVEVHKLTNQLDSDEPLRQLIRYSLPVLDGNSLFGVLEVDVDISSRFGAEALRLPWDGSLHVLSGDERWLSPQGLLQGKFEDRWPDRYVPTSLGINTPEGRLQAWQGQQGEVLSMQSMVDPNPGDSKARLIYRVLVPRSALDQQVMAQWQIRMVVPTVLWMLSYALLFFYWRLQQRHQGRLHALNANLQRQVAEQTQGLQSERSRLSSILEGTGAGTWEWNCQTGEIRLNSRWKEILGYSPDEQNPWADGHWIEQIHPHDREQVRALLIAQLKGDSAQYVSESRLRHRDGHWVWTLTSGRVLSRTPNGRAEWLSGTMLDISEMRAAQLERERFAGLLRGVLQAATDFSIIATEPDGLITLFNAGAERLLGYTADEMVGRQSATAIHLASEVLQRGAELSAAEGQEVQGLRVFVHLPERQGSEQREWTYVRKDGTHVPVSLTVTVVRNERGDVVGYLGIAQDISARLAAERALRHAKAAAEQASAAKGMFLANMSHEIRTPLNAVIGIAHLLADTPLNEDQRQLLRKLQVSGRSLLGVINDVLDLSKIEAGELAVEQVSYQLPVLLRELDSMFADQARAKCLNWEVVSAPDVPEALTGDPQRLKQVLSNLLSNAIKFTAQGGISLRVERVDLDAGRQRLRFLVRDSGIGIRPETQAQLFQPFVQAEASTTRQFGGTGLGLSIVKHLTLLMGGAVALESWPNQGSLFTIELPLQLASQTSGDRPHRLEVIVVGDDVLQRDSLVALCTGFGWKATSVGEAGALLTLMQQRQQAGQPLPDVLLLDWHLGDGQDGIIAMRRLRESLPANCVSACVLITQDQHGVLRAERRDEVVDAVLVKPANPSTLFNAVNEAIAKRSGGSEYLLDLAVIQRLGGGMLPDVRLLVVDDSDINLEVARRMLERQGALVCCDNQAEAALARLARGDAFDAVLMDIQMPGMDGLEATRQIRARLRLRELPVIALTAGALVEERRRALEAGMDDFMTKPLEPEVLVRTLRRLVEARRGEPLPVRGIDAPATLPGDWPLIDGIDAQAAAERLGCDAELFRRLLARLLRSHDAHWLTELGGISAEEAAARLHKLRGSASLLGAQRIQDWAAEGEARLRKGETMKELAALLDGLSQSLSALQSAASAWLTQAEDTSADIQRPPLTDASQAYAALLSSLRQQDLEAVGALRALEPWLRARGLNDQDLETVRRCVDELDFEQALSVLESRHLAA